MGELLSFGYGTFFIIKVIFTESHYASSLLPCSVKFVPNCMSYGRISSGLFFNWAFISLVVSSFSNSGHLLLSMLDGLFIVVVYLWDRYFYFWASFWVVKDKGMKLVSISEWKFSRRSRPQTRRWNKIQDAILHILKKQ